MSADNGIYIVRFPRYDQSFVTTYEWRVSYASAIDNCDWGNDTEQDAYRAAYFGRAPSFNTEREAIDYVMKEAIDYVMKEESEYGYLKYGVAEIVFYRPLVPFTQKDIHTILGF